MVVSKSGSQKMALQLAAVGSGTLMELYAFPFVSKKEVSLHFFNTFQEKTGLKQSALLTGKICEGDDYGTIPSGSAKSSAPTR